MLNLEAGSRFVDSRKFIDRPGLEIRLINGISRPERLALAAGMRTEGPLVAQDAHFWIQCRQGEHVEDLKPKVKVFSEDFQPPR